MTAALTLAVMFCGVPLGSHSPCVPQRDNEPGQSRLVQRWDVRRGEQPGFCGDPIGLDRAGTHLRQGDDRIDDRHVNLTCHQILQGRGAATIGHELKARARFSLEENTGDMRSTACAAVA
jgi:hypothetical protein